MEQEKIGKINYIDLSLHNDSIQTRNDNIIDNTVELFMQELELAVKMLPSDVWGIKDFLNINRYVFSQYITLTQVINDISNYVQNNCAHAAEHQWQVNAEFVEVENRDFLHILFTIYLNGEKQEEYKVKFLFGT